MDNLLRTFGVCVSYVVALTLSHGSLNIFFFTSAMFLTNILVGETPSCILIDEKHSNRSFTPFVSPKRTRRLRPTDYDDSIELDAEYFEGILNITSMNENNKSD